MTSEACIGVGPLLDTSRSTSLSPQKPQSEPQYLNMTRPGRITFTPGLAGKSLISSRAGPYVTCKIIRVSAFFFLNKALSLTSPVDDKYSMNFFVLIQPYLNLMSS